MQIVIDINEELFKATINGMNANEIWDLRLAVANGKLLPKGHGRLIDADDVNNHIIGFVNLSDCPTIIETDGGGEDEDSD